MINLVTGGAGFIGSFIVERLLRNKEKVICIDNLSTGKTDNIGNWINNPKFQFINHDVTKKINLKVDRIWHFASPASPIHYQKDPIMTSKIIFLGTYNLLEIARKNKAKLLLASTSEIYGDPEVHPQNESYWGYVNAIGKRSCYREGKRIAESLCYDYFRIHKTNISIARIFNTYGPRMAPEDGRVISNFISKAIRNEELVINGDGSQTRSFCYIDDLIAGLFKLMESDYIKPINLGNPNEEYSIIHIANIIKRKINPSLKIKNQKLSEDDPIRRNPDIKKARLLLDWEPKINIDTGLEKTISYFKNNL